MSDKNLNDYVRNLIQKGYDASTIRNFLPKYGYSNNEIESAISSAYGQTIRHEIHLSHATISVIVLAFILLTGIVLFFYYNPSKADTKLLDLNLEPLATTVESGEDIVFVKELSNLGSSKRYDVVIKQEIFDSITNKIITQKIETRAIETFGSTQTKILIPKDTKPGNYILRVIVEYDNKRAVATLPVNVAAFSKKESENQVLDCNDYDQCTSDVIENGVCINNPIQPCCGNKVCEDNEQKNCASDCPAISQNFATISSENLDEIKELARASPSKAFQQCIKIEVPSIKDTCISNIGEVQNDKSYCSQISDERIKDLCYSNIAKFLNDNSICEYISTDSRKDSCYMTFVLDNKDYTVCNKLTNQYLFQSCESLKRLDELNQQSQQQENPLQESQNQNI